MSSKRSVTRATIAASCRCLASPPPRLSHGAAGSTHRTGDTVGDLGHHASSRRGRARREEVRRCGAGLAPAASRLGVGGRLCCHVRCRPSPGDLVAGHRPAQVAHRPPGGEHLGGVLAGAAQHELALGEAGDRGVDGGDVDAAAAPSSARRAGAACRARSGAGRSSRCRRWRAPCSRRRPGSGSPAPRRRRTHAPASSAS